MIWKKMSKPSKREISVLSKLEALARDMPDTKKISHVTLSADLSSCFVLYIGHCVRQMLKIQYMEQDSGMLCSGEQHETAECRTQTKRG